MNGLYQISNYGRVKRKKKDIRQKHYSGALSHYHLQEKILKELKTNRNYLYVNLTKNKKTVKKLIHRLVAEAFLKNEKDYKYVNHLDNNTQNNNINNLEWCTQSHNIKYAYDIGNKTPPHQRKVDQIKDDKIINTFVSISEAGRKTGIQETNISKCCRKIRNHAGGYQWKYVD